jgi:hypothetical protein
MAKIHRSARGQAVDMDMIRLSNETTIAIGNQKVNARGDQLGPGGQIVKSRAEIMSEYHALNTEMANDGPIGEPVQEDDYTPPPVVTPYASNTPIGEAAEAESSQVLEDLPMVEVQDTADTPMVEVQDTADTPMPGTNEAIDTTNTKKIARGSFADSVAGNVSIDQELLDPANKPPKKPSRI